MNKNNFHLLSGNKCIAMSIIVNRLAFAEPAVLLLFMTAALFLHLMAPWFQYLNPVSDKKVAS